MASLSVAAIVVSHGQAESLAKSLEAIAGQNHPIQQVVVVETAGDDQSISLAKSYGFASVTPGDVRLGAAIQAGINSLASAPGWIWVLHDDLVAEPNALSRMAIAAEISPSVAIIGPKLLEANDSIQIQQMGLTATKTGRPFLLVQREYDQGQHDKAGDTLSVSTAGMLVSLGVWQQLGGLDDSTPALAQDLEFGAKARVAGYRVIVEASAKMHHESLAMKGKRPRRWLGGSVKSALSKAHLHFATLIMPLPVVILLYLALPLIALVSSPYFLVTKQPMRIFSQLSGWLWAWFHLGQRFAARARFRKLGSPKTLKPLLANYQQLRSRRKARYEAEPEISLADAPPGVFRSNSAWFGLLPVLASFALWPQGAITAGQFAPLGATSKLVFDSVGVMTQQYLGGVSAPSDPFGWFLALVSLAWPSNPSLAFAASVFLASGFAFFGVWFAAKQLISKPWVITLISLSYALSPQLLLLATGLQLVELLAAAVTPWAVGFTLRAFDSYNSARAWRWVGVSGLALAVVASLSPMNFALLCLLVLVLGLNRPKRFLIMIWALLPGVALLYPWVSYAVSSGNFGLATSAGIAASLPATLTLVDLIVLGGFALTATGAWFTTSSSKVAMLWFFVTLAIAASWYQPVSSSRSLLLAGVFGLLLLSGMFISNFKAKPLKVGTTVLLLALGGLSVFVYGPAQQVDPKWSETRVMPALVVAASQLEPGVRTLVVNVGDELSVDYVWNTGLTAERQSLVAKYQTQDQEFAKKLAAAAANMVAGNSEGFTLAHHELVVDFVLVTGDIAEVISTVSSVDSLQPAGESEFGALFRVEGSSWLSSDIDQGIRDYQLGVFAAFALLAIPTRASIRGYRRVRNGGAK